MDLENFGAELGEDLPEPNFGRAGRWAADRLNAGGEWAGDRLDPHIVRLGRWWNPEAEAEAAAAAAAEAEAEAEAEAAAAAAAAAAKLTRTSAPAPMAAEETAEETAEDLLEVQNHRDRRDHLGLPYAATDDQCNDKELDDYIANARDMALGGPAAGGGRTKKKKRTKKRTKKRSKKRTKKKRSKR